MKIVSKSRTIDLDMEQNRKVSGLRKQTDGADVLGLYASARNGNFKSG